MNISGNITDCNENGTCPLQGFVPVFFVLWDILDKTFVFLTNGATILIIYRHRYDMLDIPSNIFIGCLTLADMASVLNLPFSIATVYLPSGIGWNICCFGSIWVVAATSLANTITLCVIALDRLIYIIYPLEYHLKVSVQTAWRITYGVWLSVVPYSLVSNIIGYKDASGMGALARPCMAMFSIQGVSRWMIFFPFMLFVPIIIGSYVKIGLVALKQRRAIAAEAVPPTQNLAPQGSDNKITKVMLTVLLVYIVCTMVIMLTPGIMNLDPVPRDIALRISVFVWRINTWLNPVIYMWKSQKFRQYVSNFLRGNHVTGSRSII